ncbi:sucrase/ferredoxin domain-containing protein [Stagonosporopsis vannaccii]|nr:sucrase/ferredoxin domain-containing protein [Stagonosporopsis vannaccii]
MRIPLFRIWYSTTYTTLLIILLILLCASPGDIIYQTIRTAEIPKLFVIGGVYVLTAIIVILVYSTRIYTNRSVLQAIPKPYVPVEEGEVGKMVRKMIVKHLRRSAIVAWDSRPRDLRGETDAGEDTDEELDEDRPGTADRDKEKEKAKKRKSGHGVPDATILPINAKSPPWGHISHPGWASPASPDLPNLQYWSVICELPNLIEAKAVSLAPPDPNVDIATVRFPHETPLLPDAQIVTLLQRPRAMGLRAYLARLSELGLLNPPTLGPDFLAQYEHARFSTACLTEAQFKEIMAIFADILNGMTGLDPDVVEDLRAQSIYSDTRSLAPTQSSSSGRSICSSSSSSNSLPLHRRYQLTRQPSTSSFSSSLSGSSGASPHSPQTLRTAPSRQAHRNSGIYGTPRSASAVSAVSFQTYSDRGSVIVREPQRSPSTILPNSSTSSFGSGRSVIRLHPNPSEGDLPYQYDIQAG